MPTGKAGAHMWRLQLARRTSDAGGAAGKADLLALPALFADIDRPPEAVLPQIRDFQPAPSCIIGSGRGVHLYFLLDHCTTNLDLAERVLRGLAAVLRADPLTCAQSMRLIGTLNLKPQPCSISM